MRYTIEINDPAQRANGATVILYITAESFSRDSADSDFLLLVSYVIPCANRNGVLPCVHLSDDSGSGSQLATDICDYLSHEKHELSDLHRAQIAAYCCDLIRAYHDPDMPHTSGRLLLY